MVFFLVFILMFFAYKFRGPEAGMFIEKLTKSRTYTYILFLEFSCFFEPPAQGRRGPSPIYIIRQLPTSKPIKNHAYLIQKMNLVPPMPWDSPHSINLDTVYGAPCVIRQASQSSAQPICRYNPPRAANVETMRQNHGSNLE